MLDFSRLKKVIGTLSVKGKVHRLSRFIIRAGPSDDIKDAIMSMPVEQTPSTNTTSISQPMAQTELPKRFIDLLQDNPLIRSLWNIPDEKDDTSKHDWELCCACLDAGITEPSDIAAILMHNPFGKFQRDRRIDYIRNTIANLMQKCQS